MSRIRVATLGAVLAVLAMTSTGASADTLDFSTQRFQPSPHPYDYLTVMSSHVADTLDFNVGFLLNWGADTLTFEDRLGQKDHVLEGRLTGDLYASMSFFRYVSLGLTLPLNMVNNSGGTDSGFNGGVAVGRGSIEDFTLGDLRISPKVRILDAVESPVGIALAVDVAVPTGSTDALATDDGVSVFPRLIVDMNIKGYRAALNVGYKWRPEREQLWLTVDPEIVIGLGVGIPIAIPGIGLYKENLELIGELEMASSADDFFSDGNGDHMEGRLALRYTADFGLGFTLGGGGGFLTAYGSPSYRLFAGVAWAPREIDRDKDDDGIDDYHDACPNDPEDIDGFENEEGCPDPDNDQDGVLDTQDKCPEIPEDNDGYADDDGCPDPDNDKDGLLDADDGCPNEPEDMDGFEDADGCPDPDNDKDTILDIDDECPLEPEDFDGCKDTDGCPEPGDVCLDKAAKKIVILQKVFFRTASSRIKKVSYAILDEVAQVLKEHPEITKIEVQGHTDDVGKDSYNKRLSSGRAKSVRKYLIRAGVARSRLTAKGYGEDQPIDTNETDEGRSRNRRVEFIILEYE